MKSGADGGLAVLSNVQSLQHHHQTSRATWRRCRACFRDYPAPVIRNTETAPSWQSLGHAAAGSTIRDFLNYVGFGKAAVALA
jgi:hypothetical protein